MFWVEVFEGGWCPYPSTGSPALLQEVTSSGSMSLLLGISDEVTSIDTWKSPLSQISVFFPLEIVPKTHPQSIVDLHSLLPLNSNTQANMLCPCLSLYLESTQHAARHITRV